MSCIRYGKCAGLLSQRCRGGMVPHRSICSARAAAFRGQSASIGGGSRGGVRMYSSVRGDKKQIASSGSKNLSLLAAGGLAAATAVFVMYKGDLLPFGTSFKSGTSPGKPVEATEEFTIIPEQVDVDVVEKVRNNPGVQFLGSSYLRTGLFSDNTVLRDLQFSSKYGCAVDINGDVYQWDVVEDPHKIIVSRNVRKVACTNEKIYFIDNKGRLFRVLADENERKDELNSLLKSQASSSMGSISNIFGGKVTDASYQILAPEKIVDIKAGSDHILALSQSGSVYTLAATKQGNKYGQLGLGHHVNTTKKDKIDVLFKLTDFKDEIKRVAAGSNHSIILTKNSEIVAFGNNIFGQVGGDPCSAVSTPVEIQLPKSERIDPKPMKKSKPTIDDVLIAAGGDTTIFSVQKDTGSEVYSLGYGLQGQLGNGFRHSSPSAQIIKPLSNLKEFRDGKVQPISVRDIGVAAGGGHAFAILNSDRKEYDSKGRLIREYPRDVLLWGSNNDGELSRHDGKKSNASQPIYGTREQESQRLSVTPEGYSTKSNIVFEERIVGGYGFTCIYACVT